MPKNNQVCHYKAPHSVYIAVVVSPLFSLCNVLYYLRPLDPVLSLPTFRTMHSANVPYDVRQK